MRDCILGGLLGGSADESVARAEVIADEPVGDTRLARDLAVSQPAKTRTRHDAWDGGKQCSVTWASLRRLLVFLDLCHR